MDYAAARRNGYVFVHIGKRFTRFGDKTLPWQRQHGIEHAAVRHLVGADLTLDHVAPGRYLMEPVVLARLLQVAALQPSDVALVVGCTTGYAPAVVAQLSATVLAIEADADLASEATRILAEQSIDNAVVEVADHTKGWPEQGPYDLILIDGAVADLPGSILDHVAPGGRVVHRSVFSK